MSTANNIILPLFVKEFLLQNKRQYGMIMTPNILKGAML